MTSFPLAWIVASLVLLGALYLTKSAYDRRLARARTMHWRGLAIIATIGGAIVAYIIVTVTASEVPLPPQLTDSPAIATPTQER